MTVVAQGAALVGWHLDRRSAREEALDLVLAGFFPAIASSSQPRPRAQRAGRFRPALRTGRRHHPPRRLVLAAMPERRCRARCSSTAAFSREARCRAPARRRSRRGEATRLEVLPHAIPISAVARGAVAYGQRCVVTALRIESRLGARLLRRARAPGAEASRGAWYRVVPRGAHEAEVHRSPAARSRSWSGARRASICSPPTTIASHTAGEVVAARRRSLPGAPARRGRASNAGEKPDAREVMVELEGELTPVGTLDLACVELGPSSKRRYRLGLRAA